MKRVVIIGNNGSGKSFLAQRLSAPAGTPVFNLDQLFDPQGDPGEKPLAESVLSEIEAIKREENWFVEGASGQLALPFLDRADYLVWLDLPWLTCREGLLSHRSKISALPDPAQAEADLQNRLALAEGYWQRNGHRSYSGHLAIFEHFSGAKDRIVFHGCAEALYDD